MPRRRSGKAGKPTSEAPQPVLKRSRQDFEEFESASETGSPNEFEEGSSQDGLSEGDESESDDDNEQEDADAPRVVQWDDDDDIDYERDVEASMPKATKAKPKGSELVRLASLTTYSFSSISFRQIWRRVRLNLLSFPQVDSHLHQT